MFMKKKKLCGLVGCSVSEIETTDNASITEICNPSIMNLLTKIPVSTIGFILKD